MTAFARAFKQTGRAKLSLRWKFRIWEKTDFYGENVGGSDNGNRANSQPKVDKYGRYAVEIFLEAFTITKGRVYQFSARYEQNKKC